MMMYVGPLQLTEVVRGFLLFDRSETCPEDLAKTPFCENQMDIGKGIGWTGYWMHIWYIPVKTGRTYVTDHVRSPVM